VPQDFFSEQLLFDRVSFFGKPLPIAGVGKLTVALLRNNAAMPGQVATLNIYIWLSLAVLMLRLLSSAAAVF
jgi:hypothetical protein